MSEVCKCCEDKKNRAVVVIQIAVSVQKVVLVVTAALIQIAAKPFST